MSKIVVKVEFGKRIGEEVDIVVEIPSNSKSYEKRWKGVNRVIEIVTQNK